MKKGDYKNALKTFNEILSLNPDDNQGVRYLAVECLFALKDPEGVLEMCGRYEDDAGPDMTYGRALALLQLGRRDEAKKTLKEAIRWSPLVAKELIRPSKNPPKSLEEGFITSGGKDEAWEYRESFARFWEGTEVAIKTLREVSSGPASAVRNQRKKSLSASGT